MALSIGTNTPALDAASALSALGRNIENSMERLATGKRINSASDDVAGVAISSRLTAEMRGANQAVRNALDAQALIDTAEGAHKEIENVLQRMREIGVQAANDTNGKDDRANLQAEFDNMILEMDRISQVTTWAGQKLLDGSKTTFNFQIGARASTLDNLQLSISNMSGFSHDFLADRVEPGANLTRSGNSLTDIFTVVADNAETGQEIQLADGTVNIDVWEANSGNRATIASLWVSDVNNNTYNTYAPSYAAIDNLNGTFAVTRTPQLNSSTLAMFAIDLIDTAIKNVNTQRSKLGAVSNSLNHTVNNLTNISNNLSAARGGIEDADFALETTKLAKNQILQQAATAMLAQANASKQNVLTLLRS